MQIEQVRETRLSDLGPNQRLGNYASEYDQKILRSLTREQLPQDNETRWVLLYPPVYRDLGLRGPVIGIGPAGWAEVFKQAGDAWEEQKMKQVTMLKALYQMCTRLEGITVWHDPKYLMRDLDILKRRVVLNEVLQNRLHEVAQRDEIKAGRRFYTEDNEAFVCYITKVENGMVYFRPNYNGAQLENQPLPTVQKLTRINNRRWRLIN